MVGSSSIKNREIRAHQLAPSASNEGWVVRSAGSIGRRTRRLETSKWDRVSFRQGSKKKCAWCSFSVELTSFAHMNVQASCQTANFL